MPLAEPCLTGLIFLITAVHVGKIANILEDFLPLHEALKLESAILTAETKEIVDVSKDFYLSAVPVALANRIGLNDALASVVDGEKEIFEIYSFDKDFDGLENVKRMTE